MSLASLLSSEQIIPEMKATERWPAIVELIAVANVTVMTTDLTDGAGDGTDGQLNVAARSGVLKVKNRLGAAVKVSLRFLL